MFEKDLMEMIKGLRLLGMAETVTERLQEARANNVDYSEFLKFLLQDEQELRNAKNVSLKVKIAKFEEAKTLEGLDTKRYSSTVQRVINHLIAGSHLREKKNVIILGPTGTGKTHLAQALGHDACRSGKKVLFIRSNALISEFNASRSDDSLSKVLRKYSSVDLLILDDFGLKPLSQSGASDLYELIALMHTKGNMIITSNRKTEGWSDLFPDPIMACAALDRIVYNSYTVVLEGESYRKNFVPKLPKEGCAE